MGIASSSRIVYVFGDSFAASEPARVDSVVDLGGGYVVPPFGDAHSHSLGAGGYSARLADELFLRDGIFYALDLTAPYSNVLEVRAGFRVPGTLDVAYALGGLSTSTGSRPHPATTMEAVYGDNESDGDTEWTLEGDAYWFLNSLADVEEKWPEFLAQEPDVVKVYVMNVEGGREEGAECGYGLCPDVLREVVRRAHAAGKCVFAHVNTAADVRLALAAGVDALAHIPLGDDGISADEAEPLVLSTETIGRIGERQMVVTPTALLLARELESFRTDTLQQEVALQRDQLRRLHEAGARLALSGHDWRVTALREAMYLHAYDIFDDRTLLKLWAETTPRAIFPDRKIGSLQPGYEASFLVLGCNPIQEWNCVTDIRLRFKQGHFIQVAEDERSARENR